jgi:signal transduction histidine kinase
VPAQVVDESLMDELLSSLTNDGLLAEVHIAQALAECTRALTVGPLAAVETPARDLLEAAGLDVIGISRNVQHPDLGLCSQALLWVDRSTPEPRHLGIVPYAQVPYTRSVLEAGSIHRFSSPDELPDPDRSLVVSSPARLRSLVEFPILVDGAWAGGVLFGSHEERHLGSEREINLLRTISDLLSAHWSREDAFAAAGRAIEERERILLLRGALLECSGALLGNAGEDPLATAVEAIRRTVGGVCVYVDRNLPDAPGGPAFETIYATTGDRTEPWVPTVYPWSDWPTSHRLLKAGLPFSVECAADRPPGEGELVSAYPGPIEAELDYPIMIDGEFCGTVGIADDRPRAWSSDERETLGAVAVMIASFWRAESTRIALRRLMDDKDEFVATVSHELRTPLSVVVGLASILRDRHPNLSPAEIDEFTGLLVDQSGEVARLVEDLLIIARAEDTRFTVFPEVIEVGPLMEQIVASLPAEVADSVMLMQKHGVEVIGDPLRIRQVVRNLLINAHRHGGPNIRVAVAAAGGWGFIDVADDGPGIPEQLRASIFERFVSGASHPGRTGSLGLGLTVSRKLAQLMGGSVELVPSEAGTLFRFSLPAAGGSGRSG